jgi:hypothetical protein
MKCRAFMRKRARYLVKILVFARSFSIFKIFWVFLGLTCAALCISFQGRYPVDHGDPTSSLPQTIYAQSSNRRLSISGIVVGQYQMGV